MFRLTFLKTTDKDNSKFDLKTKETLNINWENAQLEYPT